MLSLPKSVVRRSLNIDLVSFMKFNSKWIIDLNLKCKTMKLLEDLGGNLDNLRFGEELKAQ